MQSKLETGITRPILQDSDHVADERAGRLEGSAYPAESPTVGVLPLRRKTLSILAAADLVAFILSFSIVLVIKYEQPLSRFLQPPLVVGLPMVWAFSTILTRKLSKLTSRSFIQNVRGFSLSFFIMLGGISLLLELFPYIIPSRFAIVGSLLLGYVLEIILLQSAGPRGELYFCLRGRLACKCSPLITSPCRQVHPTHLYPSGKVYANRLSSVES